MTELQEQAMRCARGKYQRALITGTQNWSGSDLTSKANSFGRHYATSRRRLYARLLAAGLGYITKHYRTGKLELQFGTPPFPLADSRCAAGPAWLVGQPNAVEASRDQAQVS